MEDKMERSRTLNLRSRERERERRFPRRSESICGVQNPFRPIKVIIRVKLQRLVDSLVSQSTEN